MFYKASYFETQAYEQVRCLLCPNHCLIASDKNGLCGVRKNSSGILYSQNYSQVASMAIDPIEKKPVYHYSPGSMVLSVGTLGCNLMCHHCQNWELSRFVENRCRLKKITPEVLVDMAIKSGTKGISWTYNEPTIWYEYVLDSAKIAKTKGLYTVMVTNGFIEETPLKELLKYIDVYRIDIKANSRKVFKEITGHQQVDMPMKAALIAKTSGVHVEVVTNIITTVNDKEEELIAIAQFIGRDLGVKTPWHITRFFPCLEFSHLSPTPYQTLVKAKKIGYEQGIEFIYLGNLREETVSNTICPGCGQVVVFRSGYTIGEVKVSAKGKCTLCDAYVNILF